VCRGPSDAAALTQVVVPAQWAGGTVAPDRNDLMSGKKTRSSKAGKSASRLQDTFSLSLADIEALTRHRKIKIANRRLRKALEAITGWRMIGRRGIPRNKFKLAVEYEDALGHVKEPFIAATREWVSAESVPCAVHHRNKEGWAHTDGLLGIPLTNQAGGIKRAATPTPSAFAIARRVSRRGLKVGPFSRRQIVWVVTPTRRAKSSWLIPDLVRRRRILPPSGEHFFLDSVISESQPVSCGCQSGAGSATPDILQY
jgi:hypothetical protein